MKHYLQREFRERLIDDKLAVARTVGIIIRPRLAFIYPVTSILQIKLLYDYTILIRFTLKTHYQFPVYKLLPLTFSVCNKLSPFACANNNIELNFLRSDTRCNVR